MRRAPFLPVSGGLAQFRMSQFMGVTSEQPSLAVSWNLSQLASKLASSMPEMIKGIEEHISSRQLAV